MAYLIQKRVDGSMIRQWELGQKPMTIGREGEIRVNDDRLSRQHCKVFLKDGKYFLKDLDSTNGTFVNNNQITSEVELQPNDKIRIGQNILVFSNERTKGMATIMGEIEAEGKGLHTFIGELNKKESPPPPAKQ